MEVKPIFSLLVPIAFVVLEDEARWMIAITLANETALYDFLDYIYINGLISVKPESVKIICWGGRE
jgi:hypothetical protein